MDEQKAKSLKQNTEGTVVNTMPVTSTMAPLDATEGYSPRSLSLSDDDRCVVLYGYALLKSIQELNALCAGQNRRRY